VSTEAFKVGESDFQALTIHGFTEEDAWDIAAISAFFSLSNRLANVMNIRPNDDFYTLGR
jgi:4-carboxymuconolactone decarboxylase